MNWLQLMMDCGWLFLLSGMVQQQQDDMFKDWRRNTNFAYSLCMAYQRALLVPFRNKWGTQALGFPCLFGFGLMFLWYVATADFGLVAWMGLWLVSLVIRRAEAVKIAGQVHSHADGSPINLGTNEYLARRVYEPIGIAIIGGFLYWLYTENGMSPKGLPYFFLGGLVALPFVETVKRMVWERKIQGMNDAKLESEALMEDYKNWKG